MQSENFYDRWIHPIEEQMMSLVWQILHEREAARDALQDALVVLWRKQQAIARHANPEALIFHICRQKALDHLRKLARRTSRECRLSADQAPVSSQNPVGEINQIELHAEVRRAIAALPGKQALAVIMRIVEEDTYEHVAAVLGCSEATARTHVKRGQDRLRQQFRHLNRGDFL